MSSNKTLSAEERQSLLAAYKQERLKEAPANISDASLVEKYGSDEQKKRFSSKEKEVVIETATQATNPNMVKVFNKNTNMVFEVSKITYEKHIKNYMPEVVLYEVPTEIQQRGIPPKETMGGNRIEIQQRGIPPKETMGGNHIEIQQRGIPPKETMGGNRIQLD